jgi:hypothetical protein
MAYSLEAKAPTEVVERRWTVPVDSEDAPESVVLSASGVTVDSNSFEGDELVLVLSSGTAATTGSITATVTTSQGRVLVETLYIPIVLSTAVLADTARDVVTFALRKVVGNGVTPSASEMDDGLERLNLMLAGWAEEGADVGVFLPLTANSTINCPPYAMEAIKYGMIQQIAPLYSYELDAAEVLHARRGIQRVKQNALRDDPSRETATAYY